jgi:hypothetical protein
MHDDRRRRLTRVRKQRCARSSQPAGRTARDGGVHQRACHEDDERREYDRRDKDRPRDSAFGGTPNWHDNHHSRKYGREAGAHRGKVSPEGEIGAQWLESGAARIPPPRTSGCVCDEEALPRWPGTGIGGRREHCGTSDRRVRLCRTRCSGLGVALAAVPRRRRGTLGPAGPASGRRPASARQGTARGHGTTSERA